MLVAVFPRVTSLGFVREGEYAAVDSFANRLLTAQNIAEQLIREFSPAAETEAAQQSFLLRKGNFVGVRWQSGDWCVEWLHTEDEVTLSHAGVEVSRRTFASQPAESRLCPTSSTPALGDRRAA